MKELLKIIEQNAMKTGNTRDSALDLFLNYLLEFFDIKSYTQGRKGLATHYNKMAAKNPDLFRATLLWINYTADQIEAHGWFDSLGEIYEQLYQSKGKASALGQFFTPQPLCDMMARVQALPDNGGKINDCACGSGRTLLAAFHYLKKGYYIGQDIDNTSVKMCALNMMIHGIRGRATKGDTLQNPTGYDWGYEINESDYPFHCGLYSVRRI